MLGPTAGLRCLDLGSDNGVVSLLLRRAGRLLGVGRPDRRGGGLDPRAGGGGRAPRDGGRLPFAAGAFDRVAVVDMLEHVPDERGVRGRAGARHEAGRPAGRQHAAPQAHPAAAPAPRDRPDRREARPPAARLHAAARCELLGRTAFEPDGTARTRASSPSSWTPRSTGALERLGKKGSAKGMVVTADDVTKHRRLFRPTPRSTRSCGASRAWTRCCPASGYMLIASAPAGIGSRRRRPTSPARRSRRWSRAAGRGT